MEHTGDWQNKPRRDYKYRYNGKEMVNDLGLRLYSFDTRYYDPALIDFMSVDIASDMFPSHSPYNYAGNNPINAIDMRIPSRSQTSTNEGYIQFDYKG